MKLQDKIVLVMISVVLGALTIMSLLFFWFASISFKNVLTNELTTISLLQSELIKDYTTYNEELLYLVKSRTQLRISLKEHLQNNSSSDLDKIRNILSDAEASVPSFEEIIVLDKNFSPIISSSQVRDLADFKGFYLDLKNMFSTKNKSSVILPYNGFGVGYVALVAPLHYEEDLIGYCLILTYPEPINRILENKLLLSQGIFLSIFYDDITSGEFVRYSNSNFDISTDNLKTLKKNPNELLLLRNDFGEDHYYYYTNVGNTDWSVILFSQSDKFLNPIYEYLYSFVLIFILASVVAVVLTYSLSKGVTKPISDMKKSAHEILEGNESTRIPISPVSEFSQLAQAFNKVLDDLTSAKKETQDIVEVKTRELMHANTKLTELNDRLTLETKVDPLTGLKNKGAFDSQLQYEYSRAVRGRGYLSMLMIDVDFFKNYNDALGHNNGDICLQRIASLLQNTATRVTDFVGRVGGEEFGVLLPNTGLDDAIALAEKVREAIELAKIHHPKSSVSEFVTVSIGVAEVSPSVEGTAQLLAVKSDEALYLAKKSGRNQVAHIKVT